MSSFGVTAKRLQHARNSIEEPFSRFVSWIRHQETDWHSLLAVSSPMPSRSPISRPSPIVSWHTAKHEAQPRRIHLRRNLSTMHLSAWIPRTAVSFSVIERAPDPPSANSPQGALINTGKSPTVFFYVKYDIGENKRKYWSQQFLSHFVFRQPKEFVTNFEDVFEVSVIFFLRGETCLLILYMPDRRHQQRLYPYQI
jgi:hypothetical protein